MAPCIILEPEEEEEEVMTSNLRSSFKERQCKHIPESIEVASSLTKRTCVESSQEVPILDTPLSLMPLADVARTSRALTVRSPIKNYACPIQERISTTPTPDVDHNDKDILVQSHAPRWEEIMELLKQVLCFTEAEPSSTDISDFFPLTQRFFVDIDDNPPIIVAARLPQSTLESVISCIQLMHDYITFETVEVVSFAPP